MDLQKHEPALLGILKSLSKGALLIDCNFVSYLVVAGTLHPDSYPFVAGRSDTALGPCRCATSRSI